MERKTKNKKIEFVFKINKFYLSLLIFFIISFLFIKGVFCVTNTNTTINITNSTNITNTSLPKISLKLYTPKLVYPVGSNVNLSLILTNNYSVPIFGQIRGKVIIGNVGYNILCYEHTFEGGNKTTIMRLGSLPATFSTSNLKSLTTVYQCGGTSSESTKTFFDNLPINHSPNIETFTIEPFNFTYTYNNKTYVVKSNSLKITVVSAQQNQRQNSNSQSNSQNNNRYNNNQNSNTNEQASNNKNNGNINNNMNSNRNSNTYNSNRYNQQQMQRTQTNAVNSQQNSQTINQIKKEIENSKKSVLNNLTQNPESNNNLWILLIIILLIITLVAYYIYIKKNKEDIVEEREEETKKEVKPLYLELLEKAEKEDNIKEKSKYLSQAIRTYIADKNGIDKEITHSKAIKLTKNKYFKDLLNKLEKIEFTNEKYTLDYKSIIKKVRGEFENEREE